jgi:hypothetical protein
VGDDLALELAPVFASLEQIELEAQELRRASARRIEERLSEGRQHVEQISSGWRERAESERARAAQERRRKARADAVAILEEGRAEAERIRAQTTQHIDGLVARVVACVENGPS